MAATAGREAEDYNSGEREYQDRLQFLRECSDGDYDRTIKLRLRQPSVIGDEHSEQDPLTDSAE